MSEVLEKVERSFDSVGELTIRAFSQVEEDVGGWYRKNVAEQWFFSVTQKCRYPQPG